MSEIDAFANNYEVVEDLTWILWSPFFVICLIYFLKQCEQITQTWMPPQKRKRHVYHEHCGMNPWSAEILSYKGFFNFESS